MAELNDVYGVNYIDESKNSKNNYLLNIIVNNIAHRQFNFKLNDTDELWDTSNNLSQSSIKAIVHKVQSINKKMCLLHINKQSNKINMLPALIINTPVEYFWIIDGEFNRAYFIYITPYEVSAF